MSKTRILCFIAPLALLTAFRTAAMAGSPDVGQVGAHDMGPVLLALILIIVAAKVGADIAVRIGQPPVLGEIALGLVVGNLAIFGFDGLN